MQRLSLLGIPIYTLSSYRGMGVSVRALRELGLAGMLRQSSNVFTDLGDVPLPQIEHDSGPPNLRNFLQFSQSTDLVCDAVSKVQADDLVFCLGGECGLVVGSIAGLRRVFMGEPGMLWLDAHGDFNTPETTKSGFIGGMPLAFACGRGPKFSSKIESSRPLLKEEHVVHLGGRDIDFLESKAMEESPMKVYSPSRLRREGLEKVATETASFLSNSADWLIIHLDVDVIDPAMISAVNYPSERGLTLEEVKTTIEAVRKTGKLRAFNLAAYNPTLDKEESSGRTILGLVSGVFLQNCLRPTRFDRPRVIVC